MFHTGPNFQKLIIDTKKKNIDQELLERLSKREYNVFLFKFFLSLLLVIIGVIFVYTGIDSESVIEFSYKGSILKLNNVLPGVSIIIFAIVFMIFSRMSIVIKEK